MARPRVTITLPDGSSASRETERDYTHALVHRSPLDGGWKVVSWHQGLANGRQAMLRHQREVAQHPYRADRRTGWAVVAGSIHLIAVDGSRPAGLVARHTSAVNAGARAGAPAPMGLVEVD